MNTAEVIFVATVLVVFTYLVTSLTLHRIRINRYCDMLGVGCTVSRVLEPKNPFETQLISEYVVEDKKWDHKGVCWVKLHRPADKDLTCFHKTVRVADLYDEKYVITYKK